MGHCSSLHGYVSLRHPKSAGQIIVGVANIPSRTLIWTPEYPLVTFLTPLKTLDILAVGSGNYHVCDLGCRMVLRQGNGSLFR